jgi:hypothetical protein
MGCGVLNPNGWGSTSHKYHHKHFVDWSLTLPVKMKGYTIYCSKALQFHKGKTPSDRLYQGSVTDCGLDSHRTWKSDE